MLLVFEIKRNSITFIKIFRFLFMFLKLSYVLF